MNDKYIITGTTDTRHNVEVFYYDSDLNKVEAVLKGLKELESITDLERFKAKQEELGEAYGVNIFDEYELIDLVPEWHITGVFHTAEIKEGL